VQAYAKSPAFEALQQGILEVLDSDERIPMVRKIGARFYNFWRDKAHPKGLWRRTTLDEYRKPQPAWETVLDLDALAAADGENWVWHGADCLDPDYRRCLISLSRGGADADVVREFDLQTCRFVEGGFSLPEAKNHVGWKDIDHLYVATDFGPGSMTSSSYPRIVKEWRRGTPLDSATTVYEGLHDDMSVGAYRDNTPGFERDYVSRQIDFYDSETWLRQRGRHARQDRRARRLAGRDHARVDAHRAAHRLDRGRRHLQVGLAAGHEVRRLHGGRARAHRAVRARRHHRARQPLVDAPPPDRQHHARRGEPARGAHAAGRRQGRVAAREPGRRARALDHRRGRHRRGRERRLLPHRERLPAAHHALHRHHRPGRAPGAEGQPRLLRRLALPREPALRALEGRHARALLRDRARRT
jgi:hypothetical protein